MSRTLDVLYIGWSQAKGIWGDEFVNTVFHHIIITRENQANFAPEKLRITIRSMNLKVIKEVFSKTLVKTYVDYPHIPLSDITYASIVNHKGIVFICLLVLGYDPYTGFPVHLYVYQAKNEDEAIRFVNLIIKKTSDQEIIKRFIDIENMLVEEGKVIVSQLRNSKSLYYIKIDGVSNSDSFPLISNNDKKTTQGHVNSTNNSTHGDNKEKKSIVKSEDYLILPPRDYDTIHRRQRNIFREEHQYNLPVDHLPFSKMNLQ